MIRKAILVGSEAAVFPVAQSPIHRRIVSVSQVNPDNALSLQFRKKYSERVSQKLKVVSRVLLRSGSGGETLSPVRWTGNQHIHGFIRKSLDEG